MAQKKTSEKKGNYVPLIVESYHSHHVDANIKAIWALPESVPSSPRSAVDSGPSLGAENLRSFDESLCESMEEIFWHEFEFDVRSFAEAVEVMRPHERFRMARLTGLSKAGQNYFTWPPRLGEWNGQCAFCRSGHWKCQNHYIQPSVDMNQLDEIGDEWLIDARDILIRWLDDQ